MAYEPAVPTIVRRPELDTAFDLLVDLPNVEVPPAPDQAVLDGTFQTIDQVSSGARVFPHGTSVYLYGLHFMHYIYARYGERALRDLSHMYARQIVPYGINKAIQKVTGDEGVDGEAVWTGLPAKPIVLSEQIPAGYGDPVVFCGWGAIYDEDGDGIAIAIDGIVLPDAVVGGVLEGELYPNEQLSCDWFNIPASDDDGSITIQKWTCPLNYNIDHPAADPALDCTERTDGIPFNLLSDFDTFPDATTAILIDADNVVAVIGERRR